MSTAQPKFASLELCGVTALMRPEKGPTFKSNGTNGMYL